MINKLLILQRVMNTIVINRNVIGTSTPTTSITNQLKNFQPGNTQTESQYSTQLAALQALFQTFSKGGGK